MKTEFLLGIAGAILIAILCIKVIISWLRSRPRFSVSLSSGDEPDEDDKITIKNASTKTLILVAYELYITSNNRAEDIRILDIGQYGIFTQKTIEPRESLIIYINEQYKFKFNRNEQLFIELFIKNKSIPIVKEIIADR